MNQQHTTTIPIFTIGEMKKMARNQLSGKWSRVLPAMILYAILMTVPSITLQLNNYSENMQSLYTTGLIQNIDSVMLPLPPGFAALTSLFWLYSILVAGPFSVSLAILSLKILRNEEFSVKTIFSGFQIFAKSLVTYLLTSLFSVLWMIAFMLPGSIALSICFITNSTFLVIIGFALFFTIMMAAVIFLMRYALVYFIAADDDISPAETVKKSVRLMRGNVTNYFLLMFSFLPWYLLLIVPIILMSVAIGMMITLNGVISILAGVAFIVFGIITFIGEALLSIYVQTSAAVFYSGASGNFRTAANKTEDNHLPLLREDFIMGKAYDSYSENDSESDSETDSKSGIDDSGSEDDTAANIFEDASSAPADPLSDETDETIRILENDDSLDHLDDER